MKIIIINGPNLNLLGRREPEVYGKEGFLDFYQRLQRKFPEVTFSYFQSNSEGALIDKLHEIGFEYDGVVLNGGAYTHTSVAIADAIKAIDSPVIEVHISNIHARESFRHHSYMAPNCRGSIIGLGLTGYELAVRFFTESLSG